MKRQYIKPEIVVMTPSDIKLMTGSNWKHVSSYGFGFEENDEEDEEDPWDD